MARYNRRDLFKHWVSKDQRADTLCTHACCRGYRAHPENYPRTDRARWLRGASDEQLAQHYNACPPSRPQCQDQVLDELHRRDVRAERREATERRRSQRQLSRRVTKQEELERHYVAAEAGTGGYMLNRRGREAGIDERSLFRGPEARARKYASEELLNYWDTHPRPTEAYFRGEDTRLGMVGTRTRMTPSEARERQYYEDLEEREQLMARERAAAQERAAAERERRPMRSDFDTSEPLALFDPQRQAGNLRAREPDRYGTPDMFGR